MASLAEVGRSAIVVSAYRLAGCKECDGKTVFTAGVLGDLIDVNGHTYIELYFSSEDFDRHI